MRYPGILLVLLLPLMACEQQLASPSVEGDPPRNCTRSPGSSPVLLLSLMACEQQTGRATVSSSSPKIQGRSDTSTTTRSVWLRVSLR
jgi:hypothetical protein